MKKKLFVVLALLICTTLVIAQEPIYDHFTYLPWVAGGTGGTPTATPTETPIPIETPTETPTVTTTPTLTPAIIITTTLQS